MTKAIERAVAHYKGLERGRIEVPEWGDEDAPFVIYWKPLTLKHRQKIYGGRDGRPDVAVYAIIQMAEDQAGEKLFTLEDKEKLVRFTDSQVVARIADAIMFQRTVEQARGN